MILDNFELWLFLLIIVWHDQADMLRLFLGTTIFGIVVRGDVSKVTILNPSDAI